jgi:hypothetical protein
VGLLTHSLAQNPKNDNSKLRYSEEEQLQTLFIDFPSLGSIHIDCLKAFDIVLEGVCW